MNEEKPISWQDLLGNPYRFPPHPLMLKEEGYEQLLETRITGMSKTEPTKTFTVIFDRTYLIRWLITNLISKIKPLDFASFSDLLLEAWKIWMEEKTKTDGDR